MRADQARALMQGLSEDSRRIYEAVLAGEDYATIPTSAYSEEEAAEEIAAWEAQGYKVEFDIEGHNDNPCLYVSWTQEPGEAAAGVTLGPAT